MNTILFYGGFSLAVILFLAAIFLFFFLKVPAAITYFVHYKRGSMLAQANYERATANMKRTTAMRSALLDGEPATTIIDVQQGGTNLLNHSDYAAGGMSAESSYAGAPAPQHSTMDAGAPMPQYYAMDPGTEVPPYDTATPAAHAQPYGAMDAITEVLQNGGTGVVTEVLQYHVANAGMGAPQDDMGNAVTEVLQSNVIDPHAGRVIQGITEVLDRTEVLPEL